MVKDAHYFSILIMLLASATEWRDYMKKLLALLFTFSFFFTSTVPCFANEAEVNIQQNYVTKTTENSWANYGVQCHVCKEYDYMQYIGLEQAGIGGTMYILYYKCTNCGSVTTKILNARSL